MNKLRKSNFLKTTKFLFLSSLSLIFVISLFSTLFITPLRLIELILPIKNIPLLTILILLIIQTISNIIEYIENDKPKILRRQIIILIILTVLTIFLLGFINIIQITNFETLLLSYLIPITLISVVGVLTFVNIIKIFYLYPPILFVITAIVMIMISAILLHLPMSSSTGEPIPLIDTIFVATSAVSCTGFSTISVGKELSTIGQIILMLTIQLGGLLIIFISTIGILFGFVSRDAIIRLKMASLFEVKDVIKIQKLIFKFLSIAFLSQIIVAIIIFPYILEVEKDIPKAILYSAFHVISALNNAGFSPYEDSLIRFNNNPIFLLSIAYLILIGNTSIITITEIFEYIRVKILNFFRRLIHKKELEVFRFSLFSKIILITHLILIIIGTIIFFLVEGDHFLRKVKYPIVDALFNSISFRTAGFASFDFSNAKESTYLLFSILMFIGGGSISVAGGIKMNTIAIMVIALISFIRGYQFLYFLRKEIDIQSLVRACAVFIGGVIFLILSIIVFYETIYNEKFSKIVFEITSAFGTVGTSSGIVNKNLPTISKIILIIIMFTGKIGLITILSIMSRKKTKSIGNLPKEKIIVG